MRFLFTLLFFAGLVSSEVSAQQLNFYGLDVADGLSQNTIWDMAQTTDGYMWFATADGIDRFDGYNFKNYNIDGSDKMGEGSSTYFSFYIDQNNQLWVSHRAGLHRYNRQKDAFEYVFVIEVPSFEFANVIFSEDQTSIWFLTNVNRSIRINKKTGLQIAESQITKLDQPPIPFLNHELKNNRFVYFYIAKGHYVYFDKKSQQFFTKKKAFVHPTEIPLALHDSCFLVLYNDHVYQTNLYTGVQKAFPSAIKNTFPSDGRPRLHWYKNWMVLGSLQGLAIFDAQDYRLLGTIPSFEKGVEESFSYVQSLYTDHEQNLWVGTNGAGAYCYSANRNRLPLYAHAKQKLNMTKALLGDNQGHMYVGIYKHGLLRYELGSLLPPKEIPIKTNDRGVPFLAPLSGDTIAYANYRCVYGFKTSTEQSFEINCFDPSNYITQLSKPPGSGSNLDILTFRGLYRYADGKMELLFKETKSHLFAMGHLSQDSFLIGTDFGTLQLVTKGKSKVIAEKLGTIKSILILQKRWYIATLAGLWVFSSEGTLLAHYYRGNGLPNSFLYGVLADDSGYVWMSHNAGLSRYHPPSKQFKHFTTDDGLQSSEFNTGSFTKTANGNLYFGGVGGFNEIRPAEADYILPPPASKLVEVSLNDLPIREDSLLQLQQKMHLTYEENTLSFRFTAVSFTAPGLRQYAYRLKGYDSDWIINEKRNFVRYPNLPPGQYVFEARSRFGDGAWGPTSAPFFIHIAPPFWQRAWFIIGIVLLIALLMMGLIRRWLKTKEATIRRDLEIRQKLENERQRISRDLHDNVGAQLTYLINNLDWLADRPGSEQLPDHEQLRLLSEAGRQAMLTLRQTIWAIGQESLSADDFADRFKAYVQRMASIYPGLELHFDENFDHIHTLSPTIALHFFRIGQEAIHNILKHAQASRIEVYFVSNSEEHFSLSICDNGCGFVLDEYEKKGHHGLINMKSRAEECGASLRIESRLGGGSRISLQLQKALAWV